MGLNPYLRPTVTQRMRHFLQNMDEKVPPWNGFEDVMDRLWEILHRRRNDPAFWAGLEELIDCIGRDLSRGRSRGLPDPRAEILADSRIDDLVRELRERLRRSQVGTGPGVMKRFTCGLRAPVMGCILLLGACFMAGCPKDEEKDALEVLNTYVSDSSLTDDQKQALSQCFVGLTDSQKDDLVELFKNRSAEEIAAELESMLQPGGLCYAPSDADVADLPADPSTDEAEDVPGEEFSTPEIAPPYKGVTF